MLTGKHLATWPATPLAIGTVRTYAVGLALYGGLIVGQGPGRWSGPAYATATAIAPPWVWGTVVGLFGALAFVGSVARWFAVRNVGLYGAAVWLALFGLTTLNVAARSPAVSFTGGLLNLIVAMAICWVARAREGNAPHARVT